MVILTPRFVKLSIKRFRTPKQAPRQEWEWTSCLGFVVARATLEHMAHSIWMLSIDLWTRGSVEPLKPFNYSSPARHFSCSVLLQRTKNKPVTALVHLSSGLQLAASLPAWHRWGGEGEHTHLYIRVYSLVHSLSSTHTHYLAGRVRQSFDLISGSIVIFPLSSNQYFSYIFGAVFQSAVMILFAKGFVIQRRQWFVWVVSES